MKKLVSATIAIVALVFPQLARAEICPTGYTYASSWKNAQTTQTGFDDLVGMQKQYVSGSNDHIVAAFSIGNPNNNDFVEVGVTRGSAPGIPDTVNDWAFVRTHHPGSDWINWLYTVDMVAGIQLRLTRDPGTSTWYGWINGVQMNAGDVIPGYNYVTAFGEDSNATSGDTICEEYDQLHSLSYATDSFTVDAPWTGCWHRANRTAFQGWGPWIPGTPLWTCDVFGPPLGGIPPDQKPPGLPAGK